MFFKAFFPKPLSWANIAGIAPCAHFSIIGRETNPYILQVKESIFISNQKPQLNNNITSVPLHLFYPWWLFFFSQEKKCCVAVLYAICDVFILLVWLKMTDVQSKRTIKMAKFLTKFLRFDLLLAWNELSIKQDKTHFYIKSNLRQASALNVVLLSCLNFWLKIALNIIHLPRTQ